MLSIYLQSLLIFQFFIAHAYGSCLLDVLYTTKTPDSSGKFYCFIEEFLSIPTFQEKKRSLNIVIIMALDVK